MDGFIVGAKRPFAAAIGDGVLYEASLTNASGIVKYEGLDEDELLVLAAIAEGDPLPGLPLPPEWPGTIEGLKNRASLANSVIAAYPRDVFDAHLGEESDLYGATPVVPDLVLAEFSTDEAAVRIFPGYLWEAEVVSYLYATPSRV